VSLLPLAWNHSRGSLEVALAMQLTKSRLIGFEELGDTDRFTSSMLEFRLKQSGTSCYPLLFSSDRGVSCEGGSTRSSADPCAQGVFPSGPITLSNTLPTSILNRAHPESDDEKDEDRDGDGDGRDGRRGPRKGKTGIRNGFALDDAD